MTNIQTLRAAAFSARSTLKLHQHTQALASWRQGRCCQTFRAASVGAAAVLDSNASVFPPVEAFASASAEGSPKSDGQHKSQLQVEFDRHFSTSSAATAAAAPSPPDDDESFGGILDEESDPQVVLETLGMKESDLYELAAQRPTPLKLSDMYKYATVDDKEQRLRNAQFLHKELPIRTAQRAVDLLTLPHGLSDAIPIRQVACAYIHKLHSMLSTPLPRTFEEEDRFTDLLQSLVMDQSSIPMAIAKGLSTWIDDRRELEADRLQEMEDALYRFFTARVGLRFLTEHHVLSSHRESAKELRNITCMFPQAEDLSGVIHPNLDLVHEISRVADLVVQQTQDFYGCCPEIEVVDRMDKKLNTGDFTFVPHHFHYMIKELLKNSCRATVRQFLEHNEGMAAAAPALGALSLNTKAPKLPAVRVVVVKGDEDVTIKVADKGGGIPRSKMAKIWKFAHSTADKEETTSAFGMDNLSGLKIRGFGLPLCRIYARYLGGDLTLKSMEGYGLDAYLHLARLGVACENLPRLVRLSPGGLDSTPGQHVRNFSTLARQTNGNHNKAPESSELLMEELRHCLTQDARNQRILDFLHSRAL